MNTTKYITIIFSILIVAVIISSIIVPANLEIKAGSRVLNLGIFKVRLDDPAITNLVLGITFIVVLWYAWNTYKIAKTTEERWERESMIRATYKIEMHHNQDTTWFIISNPSTLIVNAEVNCNFKIYREPVDYSDAYNNKEIWEIFPTQTNLGHFEISTLLSKKGLTIKEMKEKRNEKNHKEQLTMDLEINFTDETGNKKKLPSRRHFFDFERQVWIPEITKKCTH